MAVAAKKAGVAKASTTKPKAPPKPKFGELGYEFIIKAKIVEVNPENDEYNYPFVVEVDLGDFEDMDEMGGTIHRLSYLDRKSLTKLVSVSTPALAKSIKLDELNKAKDVVARLTKELAAIK